MVLRNVIGGDGWWAVEKLCRGANNGAFDDSYTSGEALVRSDGIPALLATIAFLVLFPGFAVYHFSVANGWMPAFAGGLFGNVSLVVAIIFAPLVPWLVFLRSRGAVVPTAAVVGLILFYGLWIALHYALLGDASHVSAAAAQAAATLVLWGAMIFTGAFVAVESRLCRRTLLVLSVLTAALLVHSIIDKAMLLGPWFTLVTSDASSEFSTYQGIGRSILVTTIILGAVNQPRTRSVIFILGLVALMSVGSRSHFFSLAALALATGFVSGRRVARQTISVLIVLVPVAAVIAWPVFIESRFGEIFALSTSGSWRERNLLTGAALEAIQRSPILGDFAYHAREMTVASYSHNALSAWTSFGLAGFLMFGGTIVYFVLLSLKNVFRTSGSNALWFAAFCLNAAALIQAVTASPVFSVLPAFAWGITLNALRTDRERTQLMPIVSNDVAHYRA